MDIVSQKRQRTVFRITMVKGWNFEPPAAYAALIKRYQTSVNILTRKEESLILLKLKAQHIVAERTIRYLLITFLGMTKCLPTLGNFLMFFS